MCAFIVTQTDFTKGISTCTMDGVCMMVDPQLRVFDSTHNIPSFDTYTASTSRWWTRGWAPPAGDV